MKYLKNENFDSNLLFLCNKKSNPTKLIKLNKLFTKNYRHQA